MFAYAMNLIQVYVFLILISSINASNFPEFMKYLYYESERTFENINAVGNVDGAFQPVVRSYNATFVTTEENGGVMIVFAVPNDDWMRNKTLQWWIVLSIKHRTSTYNLKLTYKQNEKNVHTTTTVSAEQKFAVFNITSFNTNLHSNASISLLITAKKNNENLITSDHIILHGVQHGPLLIISSENIIERAANSVYPRRHRRNIRQPREIGQTCYLREWSIDSDAITWEWIVYPSRISLNLCVGSCPLPYLHSSLNPTQHALARNMLRTNRRNNTYVSYHPAIQCVPVGYRTITLLVRARNGNFQLVTSNDLSAALCGCR